MPFGRVWENAMFESIWSGSNWLLGLEADTLTVWQMAVRALLVYPIGILFIRVGEKRFIGKFSAFDVIMGIMIGSILSRAITGGTPFFATLMAVVVLLLLHYIFATLSYHSDWFGDLVKGNAQTLVEDGEIQWDAMRRAHISEKDLRGAMRENGQIDDISLIKRAQLERSGNISVLLDDCRRRSDT